MNQRVITMPMPTKRWILRAWTPAALRRHWFPEGACDCDGTLQAGYDCNGNCLSDADGDGNACA